MYFPVGTTFQTGDGYQFNVVARGQRRIDLKCLNDGVVGESIPVADVIEKVQDGTFTQL